MFRQCGQFFGVDFRSLDTLQLWRWLSFIKPGLPESGKLTDIAKHYGIPIVDAHDALTDCRITAAIAPRIIADICG